MTFTSAKVPAGPPVRGGQADAELALLTGVVLGELAPDALTRPPFVTTLRKIAGGHSGAVLRGGDGAAACAWALRELARRGPVPPRWRSTLRAALVRGVQHRHWRVRVAAALCWRRVEVALPAAVAISLQNDPHPRVQRVLTAPAATPDGKKRWVRGVPPASASTSLVR